MCVSLMCKIKYTSENKKYVGYKVLSEPHG